MRTRVSVQLGYTKNVGDFNSLRADFGTEEDVRDDETVDEARKRVYDDVEKELISRLTELVEEYDGVAKKGK